MGISSRSLFTWSFLMSANICTQADFPSLGSMKPTHAEAYWALILFMRLHHLCFVDGGNLVGDGLDRSWLAPVVSDTDSHSYRVLSYGTKVFDHRTWSHTQFSRKVSLSGALFCIRHTWQTLDSKNQFSLSEIQKRKSRHKCTKQSAGDE